MCYSFKVLNVYKEIGPYDALRIKQRPFSHVEMFGTIILSLWLLQQKKQRAPRHSLFIGRRII